MNLYRQAMYAEKIRSKEDAPKNTNNRDVMCSQGITGVKAGSLAHGQKWRQHKYLYIDANGNYVYPEDVAAKGKKAVGDAADKAKAKLKELKTIAKDKKFKYDSKPHFYDDEKTWFNKSLNSPDIKKQHQKLDAHQVNTKTRYMNDIYDIKTKPSDKTKDLDNQVSKTAARKRKRLTDAQRKSAHAGYEAERKKFAGDLTSTEELEIQKEKTKNRKAARENEARNKDTLERMRKKKSTASNIDQKSSVSSESRSKTSSKPVSNGSSENKKNTDDFGLPSYEEYKEYKEKMKVTGKSAAGNVKKNNKKEVPYNKEIELPRAGTKWSNAYVYPDNWTKEQKEEYAAYQLEKKENLKKASKMTESEKRKRKNVKNTDQYKKSRNYKIGKALKKYALRKMLM